MSMMFKDTVILVEHLVKGNEKAFVYLVNTYHKKLFVYALSLTNDHAMSQDIVQEVFLRTWEFRKRLKTDNSINGFLYKSVYNEFINLYHRNQSIMLLEKTYIESLNEIIEESNAVDLEKKIALIHEELENLPKKCKQVFLLSKKEGLTNIEIAEYLNVSIKSVEAHITKAYSILRKKISAKINSFLFLVFGIKRKLSRLT
ncbi:RNA polymerase sigma factor [uncultured Lutibacter sp.]|uniref:RNA polymerase sigma factor n=1 Tax=uncultured Lutibacter sp. TaxID=437739 RepID=UPI002630B5DE|nr:RNA polymerase sigma-70 factor [uncultured Lutibacter sp.]